jgi:hypothetical protein
VVSFEAEGPWILHLSLGHFTGCTSDSVHAYHDNGSPRHLDQRREGAERVLGGWQLGDVRNGLFLLWQYPRPPIDKYGDRHRHNRQGACPSGGGVDAKEYRSEARPLKYRVNSLRCVDEKHPAEWLRLREALAIGTLRKSEAVQERLVSDDHRGRSTKTGRPSAPSLRRNQAARIVKGKPV